MSVQGLVREGWTPFAPLKPITELQGKTPVVAAPAERKGTRGPLNLDGFSASTLLADEN